MPPEATSDVNKHGGGAIALHPNPYVIYKWPNWYANFLIDMKIT